MPWKRLLKWMVCLLGLGFVVVLATMEVFYRVMLARVPALPRPLAGSSVPPLYMRMRWASWERSATPHVEPVWPGTVLLVMVRVGVLGQKPTRDVMPEGLDVAGIVASGWSARLREERGRYPRTGERLALTVWLTRHWSAEDLLAFEAEHRSLGHDLSTMRAAAPVLLGREWTELDAAGMALLLAMDGISLRWRDPWCFPDRIRARRNVLLQRIRDAGGLSPEEAAAALEAPLDLADRPTHWPPCGTRDDGRTQSPPGD